MKADTRQRILTAAEKAFARSGWLGATTREVARLAKVNEVTLFRHFRSKKALMEAVINGFIDDRRKIVAEGLADDLPLEAVLTRYAESYEQSMSRSADLMRAFLAEYTRRPAALRAVVEGAAGPFREQLIAFLVRRQERGEIRADVNCSAAMELFSGMFFSRVVKPCVADPGYKPEEYRRLAVEVFVRGLRP
jgi:AcrR family transcriptional regulator